MTRTIPHPTLWRSGPLFLFPALAALLLAATATRAEHGYSYVRTVEGYATIQSAQDGSSFEAAENQPLIPGDGVIVGTNSRLELLLSDGAIVRAGDRAELRLESLAWTPDTGDTSTRIVLLGGELQVVLGRGEAADGLFEVEGGNATFYLESPGEYRVRSNGYDSSEVMVRDGVAQVQTDRSSAVLRSSEAGYVEGAQWAAIDVGPADRTSRLEAWGDELDAEARLAMVPYVEPEMRYRAARMANHGSWIELDDRWGWRPHVSAGWRPYTDGTWGYTPSGLTWIANEPWGWVPSHYGTWDLVPGYGWVWFAGAVYSPASVYWYWGPTHVAWVPAGYYTSFYAPYRHSVPRLGVYGWAGGDWGFFAEWTFCPVRYFGRSRYNDYFRSGHEVGRHASYREVPRGVIATDTRGLGRDVWGQPDRITARLTAVDSRSSTGRALPDVTDFVARRREVRPEIADIVLPREAPRVSSGRASDSDARARVRPSAAPAQGRPTFDRVEAPSVRREREAPERPDWRPSSVTAPTREVVPRGTYGRPTLERPEPDSRALPTTGSISGRARVETSRPDVRRDFGVAPDPRLLPPAASDDSVARRVIEQMRSRQAPSAQRPPTVSTPSTAPPRVSTPSRSNRATPSASDASRGSGSRSSVSRSSGSRSRGSSSPPPRQAPRARSSSGKPPGANR